MIFYTANINNYDRNRFHLFKDNCDYITIKEFNDKPQKRARDIKINYFNHVNSDLSVWIDSNFVQIRSIIPIIDGMNDYDIVTMKHPIRQTIYEESKACIKLRKDDRKIIDNQMSKYKEEGFHSYSHLPATGILIRKDSEKMRKFMIDWWGEVKDHSHRDQLSFNYALSKNKDIKVGYLSYNQVIGRYFKLEKHNV